MISTSEKTRKLLSLSKIKGIGRKQLNDIACNFIADEMSYEHLLSSVPFLKKHKNIVDTEELISFSDEQITEAEKRGHLIISQADEAFPAMLRGIKNAPAFLFCAGNFNCLLNKGVAVIGTREPTNHGIIIARRITERFAQQGWNIISGLALGVDSIAHTISLENSKTSHTIAVLAHGLEKIYPAKNKKLAADIIENNGLLVTEYPYNAKTFRSSFVERDRIQAALSEAVVLIQSGVNGGSLHASKAILEFGRALVVVGQSQTDIQNNEDKIQANIHLLSDDFDLMCKTLKVNNVNRDLLLKLPNKSYYESVESKINSISRESPHSNSNQFDF